MEKLFAISYKLRYAETSDWGIEYQRAKTKEEALRIFAKSKKIPIKKFKSLNDWFWEEGVWSAEFWNIKQVNEKPCPHCNGEGVIRI